MGASYFVTYGHGKDVGSAFEQARNEALYWEGHGGYTGTIAEVHSCVLFTRVHGCRTSPESLMDAALDAEVYQIYDYETNSMVTPKPTTEQRKARDKIVRAFGERDADRFMEAVTGSKWEPCAAIEITGKAATAYKGKKGLKGTHNKVFLFAGFASD